MRTNEEIVARIEQLGTPTSPMLLNFLPAALAKRFKPRIDAYEWVQQGQHPKDLLYNLRITVLNVFEDVRTHELGYIKSYIGGVGHLLWLMNTPEADKLLALDWADHRFYWMPLFAQVASTYDIIPPIRAELMNLID